jgi:hypothetical protein
MRLPNPKQGERIKINKKLIPFSFWPTKTGARGNASLQPLLFSLDPWAIIDLAIKTDCPSASKPEALACIAQARDFFESSTEAGKVSAKPLSLYYCFMNLVKAFCLTRGTQHTFDQAQHGLSESLRAQSRELIDAFLKAFPSPSYQGKLQDFSEFLNALTGSQLPAQQEFDIPVLLPQILPGHRLWSFAANKKERFIAIHTINSMVDKTTKEMWLTVYIVADDLTRIGIKHSDFLTQSNLGGNFRQVTCIETDNEGRPLLCFEQINPITSPSTKYANSLQDLFDTIKPDLWTTVSSTPPYRRYYVYLRSAAEASQVMPQLLSIYAVAYYLGSITRYRPHHFSSITDGKYGPRVQDFITGQPFQFLYLIASEFSKRDIARPSIV